MSAYAQVAGRDVDRRQGHFPRPKALEYEVLVDLEERKGFHFLVGDLVEEGAGNLTFFDCVKRIKESNPDLNPDIVLPLVGGRMDLAVGFKDLEKYNQSEKNGVKCGDMSLRLSPLKIFVETKREIREKYIYQTLVIRGCPAADLDDVKGWLATYGAKLAPRCTELLETKVHGIWDGGFSVLALLDKKKLIPGKVAVDYSGKKFVIDFECKALIGTIWCNNCLKQGHIASKCNDNVSVDNEHSQAVSIGYQQKHQGSTGTKTWTQRDREKNRLSREDIYSKLPSNFLSSVYRCDTYKKVTHFSRGCETKFNVLSNQHIAPIVVDGQTYLTNDHYAYVQLCRSTKDHAHLESDILAAKDGATAHAIGKKIALSGMYDEAERCKAMFNFLKQANIYKFSQHSEIKAALLSTKGSRLAESLGEYGSLFWSTGVSPESREGQDPTQWRGKNVAGDMLTLIRDNVIGGLLNEPNRSRSGSVKRKKTSDSPNGQSDAKSGRSVSSSSMDFMSAEEHDILSGSSTHE